MYKIFTKQGRVSPRAQKIWLVMRITAFFLFVAFLHVSAASLAQRVTLVEKGVTLKQVFTEINKQTGYNIFGADDQISSVRNLDVNFHAAALTEVMDQLLDNTTLTYVIEDKMIIIKQKAPNLIDKAKAFFAQVTVQGKVTDELGDPMTGVTVRQKGSNNATVTDTKGAYSLNVTENNSVITFSYIGYETQELAAKDIPQGSVIVLKPAPQNLQEVVISKGYYDEKRALSTGDVAVVTAKEIGEQPVSDPIQALEGRVAGLQISQYSGVPGSYSAVTIRGVSSLAGGSDPLYIVDGVPFSSGTLTSYDIGGGVFGFARNTGGNVNSNVVGASSFANQNGGGGISPFNALNPDDIESIEVLKDADATSIYGSRGANGVILITTKKGQAGETKVDVNVYTGAGDVTRQLDLLNTQQYIAMRLQAFKNDGATPQSYDYDVNGVWDTTRYTNWQKVLIGNNASFTNANVSISGGTANTQFVLGGGYSTQGMVYPGSYSDDKASGFINLTHSSSNQRFHVQFTANYVYDDNDAPPIDLTQDILLAPDAPALRNPDGSLNWEISQGGATWENPLANTLENFEAKTANLIAHLSLAYQLAPGLKLSGSFGYNSDRMDQNNLSPATTAPPPNNTNPNIRSNDFATTNNSSWIIEPQLSYNKKISKGQLNALIGSSFQSYSASSLSVFTSDYASDALITDPAAASNVFVGGNEQSLYRYTAVYGRLSYDWEEKYLLNLTDNYDGSSRFGPDRQFGNFGAIGAGWVFSKEKPVANALPWLSFGKLRGSFGTTGNDQIGNYQYLSTYSSTSVGYQNITGLAPNGLTNPDFSWERDQKLEGGLELGFLQDRVNFSASYYRQRSSNELVGYILPELTGYTSVEANLPATIQNTGWEFTANSVNVKSGGFTWTSAFNMTMPQSKLLSFPGIANSSYNSTYAVGQSLFSKLLYHYTGVNSQTGLYTFQGQNSSGDLTQSDETWSKPVTQQFYGGLQNNFSFKGFELAIFIQFVKQLGYNIDNQLSTPGEFSQNLPVADLNAWTSPGQQTNVQQFSQGYGAANAAFENYTHSDGIITDASFIRLKNLALSYKLPGSSLKHIGVKSLTPYIQCQNLLTITGYKGLDPETQGLNLPPLRMITAGIKASL